MFDDIIKNPFFFFCLKSASSLWTNSFIEDQSGVSCSIVNGELEVSYP